MSLLATHAGCSWCFCILLPLPALSFVIPLSFIGHRFSGSCSYSRRVINETYLYYVSYTRSSLSLKGVSCFPGAHSACLHLPCRMCIQQKQSHHLVVYSPDVDSLFSKVVGIEMQWVLPLTDMQTCSLGGRPRQIVQGLTIHVYE